MKYFGIGKVLLALALLSGMSLQAEEAYQTEWVKQSGTVGSDYRDSMAMDSSGDLVIAATISSKNNVYRQYGGLVTKYSKDGILLWMQEFETLDFSDMLVTDVTTDSSNNIYITGFTKGVFAGETKISSYAFDAFIIKYDASGVLLWTKQFGISNHNMAVSITTDSNDNLLVIGNLDIASYVMKYDNDGTLIWKKHIGTGWGSLSSITTDGNGNILVLGNIGTPLDGKSPIGSQDAFVVKYDSNGTRQWTQMHGSPGYDVARSIAVDSNNNIFITGVTGGSFSGYVNSSWTADAFISKFDSVGTLIWNRQFGSAYNDQSSSITIDKNDNVFITGNSTRMEAASYPGVVVGAFVMKYSNDGVHLWDKLFGTTRYHTDYPRTIVTDTNGALFVAGYTGGVFDGEVSSGGYDLFLAKFSSPNTAPVALATATPQAVILNATTVALDASQSYDIDADNITYAWGWVSKPLNSTATLSGVNSINPTFVPDVKGDYTLYLDVTDTSNASARTEIVVTFDNIAPIADAIANETVLVGDVMSIDGSTSSDANADALTYSWSLISQPVGSAAAISNMQDDQALLTGDVEGMYEVSLIVNDGTVDSEPVYIAIEVITVQTATTRLVEQVIAEVEAMPDSSFSNKNNRKALINKLNVVLKMLASTSYQNAINKLQNDILPKVDGDLTSSSEADWIVSANEQAIVYALVAKTIEHLQNDSN